MRLAALTAAALAMAPTAALAQAMPGNDLQKVLSGNTVVTKPGNARVWVHFKESGVVMMRNDQGFTDEGTWRVTPDGQYCAKWKVIRQGAEGCYGNARVTGKVLRMDGLGGCQASQARSWLGIQRAFAEYPLAIAEPELVAAQERRLMTATMRPSRRSAPRTAVALHHRARAD